MEHYLSIAAIVRNEGRYLREWIEFHRLMGVEHFFLYDNDSTDQTGEILHPYERVGLVTRIPWPGGAQQLLAYEHAVHMTTGLSQWVAFIDADEFLWSPINAPVRGTGPNKHPAQPDALLPSILESFDEHPAVAVNWSVFGTGGHENRPDGLVIESYVSCIEHEDPVNRHVKSIIQPQRTWPQRPPDPHHFLYLDGAFAVNERHEPVVGPHSDAWVADVLRVNHYWSKSRQDAARKAGVHRADNGALRKFDELVSDKYNAVIDTGITGYVPALCEALGDDCPPGTRA